MVGEVDVVIEKLNDGALFIHYTLYKAVHSQHTANIYSTPSCSRFPSKVPVNIPTVAQWENNRAQQQTPDSDPSINT
jgi:hypothetical protein